MGVKQSLLVERDGGPLAVLVTAANVNDHLVLEQTIKAIVVERPAPTDDAPQHLCLDKGYDNEATRALVAAQDYVAHIKSIKDEKSATPPVEPNPDSEAQIPDDSAQHPPRRWVVERTLGWLMRWRGILIRWEKKPQNYLANLKLACALLWMRRAWIAGTQLLG